MPKIRMDRISHEMKREVADIIMREVKDDRLSPMAGISRFELSGDLKHARAYVSVFGEEKARQSSVDALNHAARFIRSRLAARMTLRTVPELVFELDRNIEYSFEIERKLKEVLANDDGKRSSDA